jgi:serine/threonine protein phosphatase PrpC
VTELALVDGDEFLVVASDGLWDVLDSQEVVKLARRELQRGTGPQVRRR